MTRIRQLVVLGDSLSDRGTLDKRKLLGFIPLDFLSGLKGKSPKGRFTNGYLWGDYVSAATAEEFTISHVRKKLNLGHEAQDNADISDEFLTNDALRIENQEAFSLNNDRHVLFKGTRFARYYCEGGLTSYDYSKDFTLDPTIEFPRLILSTLEKKRDDLLADDKKYHVSPLEKSETLVIEWSGANDLITLNQKPTHEEVDNAVNERIKNIEKLVQNGYRNFVLFNLPNLCYTPRFQAKNKKERDNAAECCEYFNVQLAEKCTELNKKYRDLHLPVNLSVFDIATEFEQIYKHPEQHGFEKDKLNSPYTSSDEFKKNQENPEYEKDKISPSEGYMFWDDIHPTADMHNLLAVRFKEQYRTVYEFMSPHREKKLIKDDCELLKKNSFFAREQCPKTPKQQLPEDVAHVLNKIYTNAKSMCLSSSSTRREKGELLKQLVFTLKSQKGNLETIHGLLSAFTMDAENMALIKTHHNPIYDFFVGKKTTRSEDDIAVLQQTLNAHITPTTSTSLVL
ncbi:SGNH/GDSL hydrolase family protein [Legionella maioricensis]|uniref:SGNH/GDSL hydrolase family protein n=1 Tax=Legionella maioricensis TaxID=2896528 RepID=A0A9X2IC22_9GAMM|nr:SGNH/GDSL hydrolase family protein [Legionella maioricensis]MCL9684801.1 SGNH/GDSL hydrolase family protein [Legionella maioricensis]MCL9687797.1 SGNH/GDSL hydrolase family protein [Legionella maioricensis]